MAVEEHVRQGSVAGTGQCGSWGSVADTGHCGSPDNVAHGAVWLTGLPLEFSGAADMGMAGPIPWPEVSMGTKESVWLIPGSLCTVSFFLYGTFVGRSDHG